MGTRLPPSHAPAWGRRRQEGVEPDRRTEGPDHGRGVGVDNKEFKTTSLIDRLTTRETDSEDRNKQRRLDEEAYQQQIIQRTHEDRKTRAQFEYRQGETRGDEHKHHALSHEHAETTHRKDEHRTEKASLTQAPERNTPKAEAPRDGSPKLQSQDKQNDLGRERTDKGSEAPQHGDHDRAHADPQHGRQSISRATSGMDRAAQLLFRGQGPEAFLVLSREALEARTASRGFDRNDPMSRILSALASNLDLRGQALRTTVPDDAKKLAHRMEQIARATETRADNLSARGHSKDGSLLKNVALDSKMQAALLRAGADNTDALIGRALARVLAGVVREGAPKSDLALDKALIDLDRAIDEERTPLHRVLKQDTGNKSKKKGSQQDPSRTLDTLRKNDRTKGLLDPLRDLSAALSRGDAKATAAARNTLLDILFRTGQMPHLENVLGKLPARTGTTSSPAELLERALPRLLLDGLKNGTIKELAKNGGLEPWLKSLPGLAKNAHQLHPAEKMLASHGNALLAAELGPIESLLLGGPSLYSSQGTVSAVLRARGLEGIPLSFAGDPNGFVVLPPAGRHENAVLLAPDGAIMVRTDEGPLFFNGHLKGADEQRYYYNTLSIDDELRRIMYQSASDPTHRHTRVEMGVDEIFDERDEGQDVPSKSKRRKDDDPTGDAAENLAAIAVFNADPSPSQTFQGFSTRFSARLAEDEIDRLNLSLAEHAQVGHFYAEYAADCGAFLEAMGYANTAAFQQHLERAIEAQGFTGETVGALVLIAPEAGSIPRLPERAEPKDPALLQENFVLYPCSIVID
jgi:hypothetical protein